MSAIRSILRMPAAAQAGLMLACALLAGGPRPVAAQVPEIPSRIETLDDSWQVIFIDGKRVGYTHVTANSSGQGRELVIQTSETTMMTIKRFGQTLRMETRLRTVESYDGELLSYVLDMKNPPAAPTLTRGTIKDGRLQLETTVGGRTTRDTLAWDASVKAPAFQDRELRRAPLKPLEKRSLRIFLPQFNKPTDVEVAADRLRPVKLFDGSTAELLKVRITQALLPQMPMRAYLDDKGETIKTEMNLLGMSMVTHRVDKATAVKEIAGEELDLAVNTLVRLEQPLRPGHRSRRIVYRIRTKGVKAADYFPEGGTQTVTEIDDETIELTVTRAEEPSGNRYVKIGREFTEPTQFLQSLDTRVADHAQRAVAGEPNQWRVCMVMEKYVRDNVKQKNFSTALASAAEVARNLEGDCTEHAVLLAAMLRAKRVPSRVAVGLVYIESQICFGGHMWTEAFVDGRWIPLDATLGRGGIGAAHIKLADSSFADDAPSPVTTFLPMLDILGRVEIEVVSAE